MLMYANGVITKGLCPNCDNPNPVDIRHGHNENGSQVHDYDCHQCGGLMIIINYHCPFCDNKDNTKEMK